MIPFPAYLAPNFAELAWRWALVPDQYQDNARAMLELAERARAAGGGVPVAIGSFYRNALVNAAAGGARNSQHLTASAMDFSPSIDPEEWFDRVRVNLSPSSYGQIVWHRATDGHIHISLPNRSSGKTGQVLIEVSPGKYQELATGAIVAAGYEGVANVAGRVVVYSLVALAVVWFLSRGSA